MTTARPTSIIYPTTRKVFFNYGTAGGTNDHLSRVGSLLDTDGSTHIVDYSYLGRDRRVINTYTAPGVELTYYQSGGSGDAGDQYVGLDRFGRVTDQRWRKTSDNSNLEEVKYGFDRAGNRLTRQNIVQTTGQDEAYTYDNLYQVKTLDRGTLSGGSITSPTWQERWTYDPAF